MTKKSGMILVCLALLLGLMSLAPTGAGAEPKIEWTTTNLYYEVNEDGTPENILIIEGYFTNHTDKYINYFYEMNLSATITTDIGSGYTGTVKGVFRNFEKQIEPYGKSNHRFRIRNAQIIWPVESYEVKRGYVKWKQSDNAG